MALSKNRKRHPGTGTRTCGGCGRHIWWWQHVVNYDLRPNGVRLALKGVPFHWLCWQSFPEDAM